MTTAAPRGGPGSSSETSWAFLLDHLNVDPLISLPGKLMSKQYILGFLLVLLLSCLIFCWPFPEHHWIGPSSFYDILFSFWIYTFPPFFTVLPHSYLKPRLRLLVADHTHLSLRTCVHCISTFREFFATLLLLIRTHDAWLFLRLWGYTIFTMFSTQENNPSVNNNFVVVVTQAINLDLRTAGKFLPEPIWLVKQADSKLCFLSFIA